jgi:dolichol-phosphate mannosyltransferase
MLSKYTIALLGVSALVFMLFDRRSRRWFLRPEPYLAFLLALLLFSPVIVWNAEHEWTSFVFQGPRRLGRRFDFDLPDLIGSALVLLTPAALAAAVATVTSRGRVLSHLAAGEGARVYRLLLTSTVLPLAVFAFFSLFRNTKLNWTVPLWLGILPFIAFFTEDRGGATGRWGSFAARSWPVTVAVVPFLFGALLHYMVLGFPAAPYSGSPGLGIGIQDLTERLEGVRADFERKTGESPLIVCREGDRLAGWIAYYRTEMAQSREGAAGPDPAADTTSAHYFGSYGNMYEYWHPLDMQQGRAMLLVSPVLNHMIYDGIRSVSTPLGEIEEHVITKNGRPAGRYYYQLLRAERGGGTAEAPPP